ncbi:MAG: hypothetical protein D6713_10305 [Deltaproteobacteria bacterium]|nr:MAG: hypothetical protein D6713_10305 [Deltaproteobacteria bacterium]
MRILSRCSVSLAFLSLTFLLLQPEVWAVEYQGLSSTQALYSTDYFDQARFDAAQYLKMDFRKVAGKENLDLSFYGRVSKDLNSGEDAIGRVYNFYLDARDVFPGTDLRVGRQFFYTTAGSGVVDGLRADYTKSGLFRLSFAGGREVIFSETGEYSHEGDFAFALSGSLLKFEKTSLTLSYYNRYDEGDLARESVGLSFDRVLWERGTFYLETTFDVISEVFNLIQAGVNVDPTDRLFLTLEYYRTLPTFDSTSIYSVFAVNRFQKVEARGRFVASPSLSFDVSLSNQSYGDSEDANEVTCGCTYAPDSSTKLSGALTFRDGYGGDDIGVELRGTRALRKDLTASAGIQYDSYERDLMTESEDALRYWAGAEYRVNDRSTVSLRVQNDDNENFENDLSARVSFNVTF